MTISVFANIMINDNIRFERLKLSFLSFKNCNFENWVINLRGSYRKQVCEYLIENIEKEKLDISIQDTLGDWFINSRKIYSKIKGEYIFLWNEDHMNISSQKNFDEIINEISINDIDQFKYSWFHNGLDLKSAQFLGFSVGKKIIYDNYTLNKHAKRSEFSKKQSIKDNSFLISMTSIFKKTFFKKILFSNDPIIKRWSRQTPFDFEKCSYDIHWLPFRLGYPREELFASIDDNHGESGDRKSVV